MDNKRVEPIKPIYPLNNNGYQPLIYQPNKVKPKGNPSPDIRQDYFERSNDDPEYFYGPDGNFKETRCEMKRLIRKEAEQYAGPITPRTENDIRGLIPSSPLYVMDDNSYMNYVNQNPRNKYIQKLKNQLSEPEQKDLYNLNESLFESDKFTLKDTPTPIKASVEMSKKAEGEGGDCGGCPSISTAPTCPWNSKDYKKIRDELMMQQDKQRSPQDKSKDKKKPFKEVLKDQMRRFFD